MYHPIPLAPLPPPRDPDDPRIACGDSVRALPGTRAAAGTRYGRGATGLVMKTLWFGRARIRWSTGHVTTVRTAQLSKFAR